MKKTTTRLATIAAVLVMSAFAIILAQHDARKQIRQQEPLAIASVTKEPSEPIASNLIWPGKNPIVRGNNGDVRDGNQGYETHSLKQVAFPSEPSGDTEFENALRAERAEPKYGGNRALADNGLAPMLDEQSSSSSSSTANREGNLPNLPTGYPAGDTGYPAGDTGYPAGDTAQSWDTPTQYGRNEIASSDVVAASGEQPALPAWLPNSVPNGDTAPPIGSHTPGLSGNASSGPANSGPTNVPSFPTSSLPPPSTPVATLSSPQPVAIGQPQSQGLLPIPASGNSTTQERPLSPPMATPPTFAGPGQPMPAAAIPGSATKGPALPGSSSMSSSSSAGSATSTLPGSLSTSVAPQRDFSSPLPTSGFDRPFDTGTRTALVSNQPGSRFLDGSQNPIMLIQKRAPDEIQVGKNATFVIAVRNAGNAAAHEVTVVDRVPQGARFVESSPSISPTADGLLAWTLGEMAAGDERTITLQLIPEVEGEVGSVASVHFAAQASVRTVATLPQVVLQMESIAPVTIGQSQQLVVNIQNTGSGVARSVRLEADIPAQLRHESGETQLEALVGDLRPGESRRLTLGVAAVQPGQSQCVLRAVNDDGLLSEQTVSIDVRAPQLAASISGPNLRYLERQASYQVMVSNTGTAVARNLDFVIHLPVGLKFISADIPQANYNPQSHTVALGLAELESGQSAPFMINVLPVQLGTQIIRFNGTGDLGVVTEAKAQVTVAGLAELSFTIGQDNGTVEVGASTTYAVQVSNIGNQPDKNVQLTVQLPQGTKLIQVDAPVEYRVEAGKIVFSPVAEMRNRDVKTFRFQIQHNQAGNQVVRSQLTSENWPVAVVKEEGTLVYNDRN